MRVVAFVADRYSGSSRLRVLQFVPMLQADGHHVTLHRTVPSRNWRPRVGLPQTLKAACLLAATALIAAQRLMQILVSVHRHDVVIVQKGLSYRLPLLRMERLLIARARRGGVRVVLDVDDAILVGTSAGRFRLSASEAERTARASDLVVAGSNHLFRQLRAVGARAELIPTCVTLTGDGSRVPPRGEALRLCWTGAAANLAYLTCLLPVLAELNLRVPLSLDVVTNLSLARTDPAPGLTVRYTHWSASNEARILATSHVGLAPLPDDAWTAGKCAARLLAYFAAGLPAIASPIGAQAELAWHEVTALVATDAVQWQTAIERLSGDDDLYVRLATGARAAAAMYTPQVWYPQWQALVMSDGDKRQTCGRSG